MNSKVAKSIDKLTDQSWFENLILTIGVIIGIIISFYIIDYTPATEQDYKQLLEIQDLIIQDFNNVYNYPDADITITDNNIKVFIENDECSLNIMFNKAQKYMYTENSDKSVNTLAFLFLLLFISIPTAILFLIVILIFTFFIQLISEGIYNLRNKNKTSPWDNIT